MQCHLAPDAIEEILSQVAAEILAEAAIRRPPVDALLVASRLGICVAVAARQRERARYVALHVPGGRAAQPSIVLRPEPRFERRQWAVAHEIGEQRAYRVFQVLGGDPRQAGPNAREAIANGLAGRLLLPRQWFAAAAAECGWDLAALKRRFSTASHELVARRMLDFAPPQVITIVDQGRTTFRAGSGRGRAPGWTRLEQTVWQQAHQHGRHARGAGESLVVDAWPVHESNWRREIVRTAWRRLETDDPLD